MHWRVMTPPTRWRAESRRLMQYLLNPICRSNWKLPLHLSFIPKQDIECPYIKEGYSTFMLSLFVCFGWGCWAGEGLAERKWKMIIFNSKLEKKIVSRYLRSSSAPTPRNDKGRLHATEHNNYNKQKRAKTSYTFVIKSLYLIWQFRQNHTRGNWIENCGARRNSLKRSLTS